MTIKEIKEIKEFVQPIRKFYLGKIVHGSPYFYPRNFEKSFMSIRKLIHKSSEKIKEYNERYPHLKGSKGSLYENLPIVRRNKEYFLKIFNSTYYVTFGWPIAIAKSNLGWKDKWDSPRFEWCPFLHFYFFKWQFCIWWEAPDGNNDRYYEMMLWFYCYSDKDIKKAENTWRWVDYKTKESKESSWDKKYLK